MPQAQPEDTRRERAEAYQQDWGGALFEQADGDWIVVGSIIGTGAVQSVRFTAGGQIKRVEIPLGGKSKPQAANDNKLFAGIIPPTNKTPSADELRRLQRLVARYGGQLTGSAIIRMKGAEKDAPAGNIWIHSDGKPYFRTGDG